MQSKSINWFLHERDLRHKRVNDDLAQFRIFLLDAGAVAVDSWFVVTQKIDNSVVLKWTTSRDLYKLPLMAVKVGINKQHSINQPTISKPCGTETYNYTRYYTTSVKLNHLDFYSSYCIKICPIALFTPYSINKDCIEKGVFESGESGNTWFLSWSRFWPLKVHSQVFDNFWQLNVF